MKKSKLFPASLALLALGSLPPLAHASSPQPSAQDSAQPSAMDAFWNSLIEDYNEELRQPIKTLHRLRAAPSLARVIQSIPFSWEDGDFIDPEERDDYGYDAYAKAQAELLAAVEMTPYESEQQQEQLWKRTLAAQAELKAKYPHAAEKLTDLVALVDEIWRREQARPQAEREKNAAEYLSTREEEASKSGYYLCYHQYSPAMQELLLHYLTLSLEYEIRLCSQDPPINYIPQTQMLVAEEIRILQSLDTSKLNEEQREDLQQAITRKIAFSRDLAKVYHFRSLQECFKKHAEVFSNTIWDTAHILEELLKHLDLLDEHIYVMTQENAKMADDDESLQHIARTNRRILDAIKKAMAAQKTAP